MRLLLLVAVLTAGCAEVMFVERQPRSIGDAYMVEPQIRWISMPARSGMEVWTVDGAGLNALTFVKGLKDGEVLMRGAIPGGPPERERPRFVARMTPSEIVEMVSDSFALFGNQKIETSNLRPASFGTADGFRFDMNWVTRGGLEKQALVAGAVVKRQLHLIIYEGTRAHYFATHRDDAERVIASIRLSSGYVQAAEPEWDNPPEGARRRPEVTPPVTVAPTPPRSSHTMVVGMWSGTLHGQRGSYPLTVTFRDDGTYHATSATLNAGSFDGTWQLAGGKVVWESVTTGRTGTATIQEANGQRTLRIVPDDGTYTAELTPTVPFDLRTWLPGNWSGSGGGYELTISSNLTWQYTSTVNGRWFASGSAHINDPGTVVLEGWFRGSPSYGPAERLTMILHRYGESLTGEFRLSRTWHVTFSRAGRPATK